jgi:hypothetical protein
MQRRHLLILASLAFLTLPGCSGLLGPQTYTVDEAELGRLLARQFPKTQSIAGLAELTLASPALRLLPERNKLGAQFDLAASERLSGRSTTGRLDLEGALRYEPSDQSLRLAQVRVQQLQWEGAGSQAAQRAAALVAERLLEDMVLYRLKPEQAQRMARAGLSPGAVTVTPRGVELAFEPAQR